MPQIYLLFFKIPEVSPKLYHVDSSNHAQQGVDERFFKGFEVIAANGIKILT